MLALVVPPRDATLGETTDLLPASTPMHQAVAALSARFGQKTELSSAVVVFERRDGVLTARDLADIERFAIETARLDPSENFTDEWKLTSMRTPAKFSLLGSANPLISADGHAALVWISLPFNYITKSTARIVHHIQTVLGRHALPTGMRAAVTGSAGYGYDYAVATERSHEKTTLVTLISVIVILLLVYRAPVAAVVPLLAVSIAALVTFKLLASMEGLGLHSGTAERIFTFVLLYGAGVDYSLLFMSRYREFLDEGASSDQAVPLALRASTPAIVSSAAMTMAGLITLSFARFSVYRDSGPAVVLAIGIAALAAATLVPAMLSIIGPVTFWPSIQSAGKSKPIFWPTIARIVGARPGWVMAITVIALGLPAVQGMRIKWNYDALFSLKPTYQARQGTEIVTRHWPAGEIAPVTLLVQSSRSRSDTEWLEDSRKMVAAIRKIDDVGNVRGLSHPLGIATDEDRNRAVFAFARDQIHAEYISPDGTAMRLLTVLKIPPLTTAAMDDAEAIKAAALQAMSESSPAGSDARRSSTQSVIAARAPMGAKLSIQLIGVTAEMRELRDITHRDFVHIAFFCMIIILLVVWAVLRDLPVAFFILAATTLSYLTTLGLTCWIFQLLGSQGLEWKVQMLLFIVLIAVGQDYSIFFAVRFAQEARKMPCKQAVMKSLVFTGPVISSCGLIMAATLGSVMAGDVQLLLQLGFAFALGMLIDTFIVRPLLLPSLILLSGRTLSRAAVGKVHEETVPVEMNSSQAG